MTLASSKGSLWQGITLVVLLLVALFLLIGGIWLASLGGSYYYAITGIILLIISVLYWRRSSASIGLYALLLIATILWGLWESGTDFWALAPRYDVIFLLGLWLILPPASRRFSQPLQLPRFAMQVGLVGTLAVLGYAIFNDPQEVNGTLKNPFVATNSADSHSAGKDWTAYGGTPGGTRYSSLVQVNTDNVGKLQEVWRFRTGDLKTDADPVEITNEVTPLKVGNTLYLCTAHQKLFALDATTGEQKWAFDPKLKSDASFQHLTCRGVSYHDSSANAAAGTGSPSLACPRKVFLPVNDGRLFAINPENGQPCEDFGEHGVVNLQANMPHNFPGGYEPTSPPVVTDKTIVMAGAVTDNFSVKEPSGVIRGYDVNNGKLLWVFDTGAEDPNAIPKAGENFTANSPNSWAPSAYDPELDLVYVPTGVQTPDIWGGNRTPNMERYATSILALNATTGKLVWSYQTVHHDLWDMDVPAQPSLVNIDQQGKVVPAIYAPTKTGNIFVLDRRTGQLIVPAPEKPVPQGPAKGDRLSPTQPFSDLSYRPTKDLTDKNMWGATTFDQLMCRISFHKLRYEGIFTPPSEQGTLVFPGNLGMFEWGGISVNQDRQVALSNPMGLPFVSKLIPRGPNNPLWPVEGAKGSGTETGIQPQYGVPFGVEIGPFLSAFGLPCKEPGWGFISALDLKTQQVIWKKRIGTIRDSLPGIQLPPLKIGVPMLGGPISTAGNLMFIAATQDNYLRAFNIENGDQLWQTRLPAGGQATPMTYEANGKQFVVIAAGGHGSFGTKMGDYIIAYALPGGATAAN